jgi:hypothetical protein
VTVFVRPVAVIRCGIHHSNSDVTKPMVL